MTPEEIAASYHGFKIVVRRWLGTMIDIILLIGMIILADLLLGNDLYQKTMWFWLLMPVAYYVILEGYFGLTVGKLVARIRIVDQHGNRPGLWRAVVRTLFRLIEVNPIVAGGLPAGLVVLANSKRQRIGDMVAKTFVLKTVDIPKLHTDTDISVLSPT